MPLAIRDIIGPGIIPFPREIGGGATDNTPNAVDWGNVDFYVADNYATITSKQITGVTSGIYLNLQGTSTLPNILLYYRVDNSEQTGTVTGQPSSPWVQIAEASPGTTFAVNNNQWVSFACYGTDKAAAETQTVYNASDSNTTLDTFTAQVNS